MIPMFKKRRAEAAHGHGHAGHTDAELRAAYERGRREEKARHRRSPLIAMAIVAVALVGGASLVLAAKEGSFREGGAAMDAGVRVAAREAVPTLKKGVEEAGEGLRKVQEARPSDKTD